MKPVGRNDPCTCGSGQKYKKCCLGKSSAPPSGTSGVATNALTIIVDAAAGTLIRHVPDASPLPPGMPQGDAAELMARDAAGLWGLPDFVFRSVKRRTKSGTRELSDGLIVAGRVGISLQVKSRTLPLGEPRREHSWITKNCARAISQANGTIRQLKRQPATFRNLRDRAVTVDGNAHEWVSCVILDHPDVPLGAIPSRAGAKHPTVVLTRRDWEFLYSQLKSTVAVARYLQRIADQEPRLGDEPARYFELALADEQATPDPIAPELVGSTGRAAHVPLLPIAQASVGGTTSQRLFRVILEDIATSDFAGAEADRIRLLAEMDRLPVAHRTAVGEFLLEALAATSKAPPDETWWNTRSYRGGRDELHLGFAACSTSWSTDVQTGFQDWVQLRHYDMLPKLGDGITTVGIVLTPHRHHDRDWDTTMIAVSGSIRFKPAELAFLRKAWPTETAQTFANVPAV